MKPFAIRLFSVALPGFASGLQAAEPVPWQSRHDYPVNVCKIRMPDPEIQILLSALPKARVTQVLV